MSVRITHDAARRDGARPLMASICSLVAALAVAAAGAGAQSTRATLPNVWLRPELGAYIPTGQQRDLLGGAILAGVQGQWSMTPRWALTGSYAWSPTHDRTTTAPSSPLFLGDEAPVNVQQWDVGVQAYLANAHRRLDDGAWAVRPFLGAGVGDRMYKYTEHQVVQDAVGRTGAHDTAGYGALGADVAMGGSPFGLHLELRDNVSKFRGTYGQMANATTRNDLTLAAGVNLGF